MSPPPRRQDELCDVGPYHSAQSAKIGVDGREHPQGDDQNREPHGFPVADPRDHLAEDAIERVGGPEQRRAEVEQRVEHDHQQCVRQRDPRPEALLEKLTDRDDLESEIEGDEKEGGDHNAEDGVELEVPLRQSADVGRARHGEKVAGLDVRRDRRHRDGRPPQGARAEEILLGTDADIGARPQANDENDGEVRDDDPKVDHGRRQARGFLAALRITGLTAPAVFEGRSTGRPCPAARVRRRVFTSSSRLRIVIAPPATATCAGTTTAP